jgi:hypothetical protein
MNTLKARALYAIYMLLPLPLALWHIERLSESTLRALRGLFPPL